MVAFHKYTSLFKGESSEMVALFCYAILKKPPKDSLSEEDKKDIIEVDGRKYIRKIYELNNK